MTQSMHEAAKRLLRNGKQAEAAAIYAELLRQNPSDFDALHALGIFSYQTGQLENAERLIGQAAGLRPGIAELAYNHACILQKLNRHEEAVQGFERALAVRPDYLEALVNRGAALTVLKRFDDALTNANRVIAIKPDFAEAWHNRAVILLALGHAGQALADWDQVLTLNPRHPAAWKSRAATLHQLGRNDEALAAFSTACELAPADSEPHGRLADLLLQMGRYSDAAEAYDRYLRLAPNNTAGWQAIGFAYQVLHRREEALDCFNRGLWIEPQNDAIRTSRANILFELERWDDAARDYEILLASKDPAPWLRGYLAICRMHACDWRRLDSDRAYVSAALKRGEFVIDPLGAAAMFSEPVDQIETARIWARDRCPALPPLWTGERYQHQRTRIAYLSSDFRAHATAFLMAGVFEQHDRSRFEITAISWSANDGSPTRERLLRGFDRFVELGEKSDAEAARIVRELEIDIAVDLKGYTNESRPAILAHRPAPVQAQYLGFPGTMAVPFIDYLIADAVIVPEQDDALYAEKIVRLPHSYQCNDNLREWPARVPSRQGLGLPSAFVFCCFNASHKISPELFAVWMRILRTVNGSVLWLLKDNAPASDNLRDAARAHGIAPDRLIFAPRANPGEHLARQAAADLFLDTIPYNAHTGASDALWAGLPLLTLRGRSFAGRVGASVLTAAGLPELITETPAEYERLAIRLAADPQALTQIRQKLRDTRRSCALFDTGRITRHLESAYEVMVERQYGGLPPASFSVPAHS